RRRAQSLRCVVEILKPRVLDRQSFSIAIRMRLARRPPDVNHPARLPGDSKLWISAGTIGVSFRPRSACTCRSGDRLIGREGSTGPFISHGGTCSAVGAVLVSGAAFLLVTACDHQCRPENQ